MQFMFFSVMYKVLIFNMYNIQVLFIFDIVNIFAFRHCVRDDKKTPKNQTLCREYVFCVHHTFLIIDLTSSEL